MIGYILGTQPATPLEFWVAVDAGQTLRLDDVVKVVTQRPDTGARIEFYGIVDRVQTQYEGAQFDSDTFLAQQGQLPINTSYTAHVRVTRIEPEEELLPPFPGTPVELALGSQLEQALYFDSMDKPIPAGLMTNGSPASVNFSFINGEKGAHINISGLSGVATKTSYMLFLLHSIFNSKTLGTAKANTKALIFNVKGEDLFFIDQLNKKASDVSSTYQKLNLPAIPFQNVSFRATPKPGVPQIEVNLDQRAEGVTPYLWSIREVCRDRLFSFLFTGEDLERGNLPYLISNVEERLAQLAEENDRDDKKLGQPLSGLHVDSYGEDRKEFIESFSDLIRFLEDKLITEEEPRWLSKNAPATANALIRRLFGIRAEVEHLIRGDLAPDEIATFRLDPLTESAQIIVADIHRLGERAQKFVVGTILQRLFTQKERQGREPIVMVTLDELNKYAPREGRSPIKSLLTDIAERGRSLGIILIGAQQTASEVERRVVGQAAVRVVGRLDSAEATRPEYNFLTASAKDRVLFLKSGSLFIQQPEVPAPLLIRFPFPAYATRKEEVQKTEEDQAKLKAKIKRLG
ncbi:MAG: ATP-binding protein [Microcoleaceae cyanobacterium]